MSHVASHYAKHLVKAPGGERINVSEKAVLCQLADDHREELGVAWPSMKALARRCCLSERQTRRIIAGLEGKGILRRIPTRRDDDGRQTSNEYVFLALDSPSPGPQTSEARRRLQKVPRSPMSAARGHGRPGSPVTSDRPARPLQSESPGHQRPPIEPLVEPAIDSSWRLSGEPYPPTPHAGARGTQYPRQSSNNAKASAFTNLALARSAWTGVMKDLSNALLASPPATERRPGFTNGAEDWKSFRFGDVAVVQVERVEPGALMIELRSPQPEATEHGLAKYQKRIAQSLRSWYGCEVRLSVCGSA